MTSASPNPYVGLDPFSAEHARYFFGRALDAKIIANNVLTRPITVVFAASGVGKSSVLAAGLPSALQAQFGPVTLVSRRRWHQTDEDLRWLNETLQAARATPSLPLILVFDQFEDYFLYRPKDGSDLFEQELAAALSDSTLTTHVLLSLREDALHFLDHLRLWLPAVLDNTIELEHLDEDGVRDAIERPVEVFNAEHPEMAVAMDPGFADDLVADIQGSRTLNIVRRPDPSGVFRVPLPFLQLTLQQLWNGMQALERRKIDGDLLRELGGVDGIVRSHLHRRLDDLSVAQQLLAMRLFHYLVTPSGGKIAYTANDLALLATESGGSAASEADVELLLVTLSKGQVRILQQIGNRFELFHDVLAPQILDWRAERVDTVPFGYLTEPWTKEQIALPGYGGLFERFDRTHGPPLGLPMISRTHFLVMRDGLILDLRSRFGTTINARPLHFGNSNRLRSGDIVGVGNTAALIFHSVLDPEPASVARVFDAQHSLHTNAWGLMIDGDRRLIIPLDADETYLFKAAEGGVDARTWAAQDNFALLRRDNDQIAIRSLTDQPSLEVIDRLDSRRDHIWTLEQGEESLVQLQDFPHPNPETMSHLEGAHRSVYRVDDRHFEIILNYGAGAGP